MLRKFLSDIAFMQMLNLLVKPIWILVIDRAVQDILPQEVYGNYFALLNFCMLFFIVLDLGLNGYNTTQVSRDEGHITKLTGNILGLKLMLSLVYVALVFAVGYLLGFGAVEFQLLILLSILQIVTSFNQYLRTIVSSLQRFKWDGVFMVMDRTIVVVLCAFLLWGGFEHLGITIQRFVYAQIIGVVVVLLSLVFFLRSYLSDIKLSFRLKDILPVLVKSWPFALLVTLMSMYNYLDGVMLKTLAGNSEAGVYAMGYRLFFALLMFAQIFSGVLLPFFSKHIGDHALLNRISNYTFKLLFVIGITAALVCFAYSKEIIHRLYPQKESVEAARTFGVLMFGFIGSALTLVYGTLLTAGMRMKQLNIMAFVTLLLNVLLNMLLIPKYGALGAAIATVSSQVLFGVSCFLNSKRNFHLNWKLHQFTLQFVGVVSLFVVIVILKQYLISIVVHLGMITLTVLLSAYLFKLFEKKHLNTLVRK